MLSVLVQNGFIRWVDALFNKSLDVQAFKEGMRKNVLNIILVSKSLSLVFVQQLRYQVLGERGDRNFVAQRVREVYFLLFDQPIHFVLVFVEKGRKSNEHFIHENS